MPLPPEYQEAYNRLPRRRAPTAQPVAQPAPAAGPQAVFGQPIPPYEETVAPRAPGAYGQTLRKSAQTVERALPLTAPADVEKAYESLERLPPERQAKLAGKMEWGAAQLRGVRRGADRLAGDLEAEGFTPEADRLTRAGDVVADATAGAFDAAGTGAGVVLDALDWSQRQVRRATMPGPSMEDLVTGRQRAKDPTAPTPDEWNRAVREEAGKGRLGYQVLKEVGDVPGRVFGGAIGATLGGLGAVTDVLAGSTPTWENFSKTVEETQRDTGDFARTMLTDPLAAFGAAGGGARGVASALGRAPALRTYMTPAIAGMLESTAAKGMHARTATALRRQLIRAGVPAAEAEAGIAQAFGAGREFLGRAQAGVGVPVGDLFGLPLRAAGAAIPGRVGSALTGAANALGTKVPLAPLLGLPDYAAGKAIKSAIDPMLQTARAKGFGLPRGLERGLFDPARRFLSDEQAVARGKVATTYEAMANDARNMMKVLPSDQAARQRLIRGTVDPSYVATPTGIGPSPQNLKTVVAGGVRYGVENAPGSIFEPASSLPKEGRTAAAAMRRFFNKWGNELEAAGVLEPGQRARNLLTDRYFPRITEKTFGFLDDLAEKSLPRGTSSFKHRGPVGGTPLGTIADQQGRLTPDTPGWYLDAKFDPADVIPQYARQASRAVGETHLENYVAKQFGRNYKPDQTWTELREGTFVPTDLHNMMRGTFDESMKTMSSFARKQPWLRDTAEGRAVLGAIKIVDKLGSRLKYNLTGKVPGFHALNKFNDILQSAPYARDYVGSGVLYARIRGAGTASLQTPTRTLSADQVRGLMRRHNIAMGTLQEGGTTPLARLDLGDELKNIARLGGGQRAPRGMTPGEAAGRAWRAYDKTPERVGGFLRDHSEGTLFVDRLRQGDSPEQAARVVRDALLDYADVNVGQQIASWFIPFARYLTKAPGMVAKAAVRNPGAVNAFDRFMDATHEDAGPERPKGLVDRGPSYRLSDREKQVSGNMLKFISGGRVKGWPEGLEGATLPRAPFAEALAPLNSREQFVSIFGPGVQAAASMAAGVNPITRREVTRPETMGELATGLFPMGFSGAVVGQNTGPAADWARDMISALEVSTNSQVPLATQVLAPYALSPVPMHLTNEVLHRRAGGPREDAPPGYLGNFRDYAEDPEEQFAFARRNLMSRMPDYTLSPNAPIANRLAAGRLKAAQKVLGDTKRSTKRVRRARDE